MTGKNDCVNFDVAQVIIRVDEPIFPHKQLEFKSNKKLCFVASKVFQHFHEDYDGFPRLPNANLI